MSIFPMRMRRAVLRLPVLALAVVTAGPVSAAAAGTMAVSDVAPPGPVTVKVMTVNGSGCPAGTASVRPTADNTGFTVVYSDFVASAGGRAAPTDFRKNCQLAVLIDVPQGFTYAIAKAEYSGGINLAPGATSLEKSTYYFQGSADEVSATHAYSGGMRGRWYAVDAAEASEMVWAPCGVQRVLNINSELRVDEGTTSPGTTSSMSMRWSTGSVSTIYHLSWATC
jgi:hypothetical protein